MEFVHCFVPFSRLSSGFDTGPNLTTQIPDSQIELIKLEKILQRPLSISFYRRKLKRDNKKLHEHPNTPILNQTSKTINRLYEPASFPKPIKTILPVTNFHFSVDRSTP